MAALRIRPTARAREEGGGKESGRVTFEKLKENQCSQKSQKEGRIIRDLEVLKEKREFTVKKAVDPWLKAKLSLEYW